MSFLNVGYANQRRCCIFIINNSEDDQKSDKEKNNEAKLVSNGRVTNKKQSKGVHNAKCHECNISMLASNYLICKNELCNLCFCIKCARKYNVLLNIK